MYVKTNWVDDVTPISAANLNKMEEAIYNDGTWVKIAEQTLASAVAQVDFSSIPSGYKNFHLIIEAIGDTAFEPLKLIFNNDVGSNYKTGTTLTTYAVIGAMPTSAESFNFINALISNFNPLQTKRMMSQSVFQSGTSINGAVTNFASWLNTTTEINKISIKTITNLIGIGSRFVLWGCK